MTVPAGDGFEEVYAERLWSLVPAVYRDADGLSTTPGTLRAVIEVVAGRAAALRRSGHRLLEDEFIELCDDWAVPYIGDLLATRMVSALNPRARRIDVAKTIHYRRRKGTLGVLEELIVDITEWDGTVREEFRRLARFRHGLDPKPQPWAGRRTGTLPGGLADLRSVTGSGLAATPFDEFHHLPDLRRHRGVDGRRAIPKLGVHLYRLGAYSVRGVQPGPGTGATAATFDPSGRNVNLFQPRGGPDDWEEWRTAREWEVTAPLRCRMLGDAEYRLTPKVLADLAGAIALTTAQLADLETLLGRRLIGEAGLRDALAMLPTGTTLLLPSVLGPLRTRALAPDCGKAALLDPTGPALSVTSVPPTPVPVDRILAGNLETWTTTATGARVVIDPDRGRMLFLGGAPGAGVRVSYHIGAPGDLGAGPWARGADLRPASASLVGGGTPVVANPTGVVQIDDSSTYGPLPAVVGIGEMVLQAADHTRPYLRATGDWILTAGSVAPSTVLLDGVWVGASTPAALRLRGRFDCVVLRHCTLDPGGTDALGGPVHPVGLVVEGHVDVLELDRSVTGPIRVAAGGSIGRLVVRDSAVVASGPGARAIDLDRATADLQRSTFVGAVRLDRVSATDVIVSGTVDVTDTQAGIPDPTCSCGGGTGDGACCSCATPGCFRFSAMAVGSRVPRPYECVSLDPASVPSLFTSATFGHHAFLQLSEAAPPTIARGASNGSEMGVYQRLANPVQLDSLKAKVDEFAPFGVIPYFSFET